MTLDGKALERAIELIERQILDKIEKSNIGEVVVETRKIIIDEGVRHEIDIFVTVNLNIGTPLIYIFESKNRKEKADKNDIIVFEAKIDAANAQNGYFVSREFTKDALNQAKKFPRISLNVVEENNEYEPDALLKMQFSSMDKSSYHAAIFPTPSEAIKLIDNPQITLPDGRTLPLEKLINEKYSGYHARTFENDPVPDVRSLVKKIDYEIIRFEVLSPKIAGEQYLFLGVDIYTTYITKYPQIVYDFKIQDKGRYFKIITKDHYGTNDVIIEVTTDQNGNVHFHRIDFQK